MIYKLHRQIAEYLSGSKSGAYGLASFLKVDHKEVVKAIKDLVKIGFIYSHDANLWQLTTSGEQWAKELNSVEVALIDGKKDLDQLVCCLKDYGAPKKSEVLIRLLMLESMDRIKAVDGGGWEMAVDYDQIYYC